MSAGFILDGVKYEWGALSEILVRDQIKVERWLRGEGREYTDARTWEDVLAMAAEVNDLGDFEEQKTHPDFKFALSVTIWLGKVKAGEDVALADCFGRWTWDELDFWADEEEAEGKGDAAP